MSNAIGQKVTLTASPWDGHDYDKKRSVVIKSAKIATQFLTAVAVNTDNNTLFEIKPSILAALGAQYATLFSELAKDKKHQIVIANLGTKYSEVTIVEMPQPGKQLMLGMQYLFDLGIDGVGIIYGDIIYMD